jgi:purine-nucleoside phosphorylase
VTSDVELGYPEIEDAAAAVRARIDLRPRLGIVLGSGLGALTSEIAEAVEMPYPEIPHFPLSTAPGHAGFLAAGLLEGQPVVALSGRVHLYEGYSAQQVAFPVRVLRALGVETLSVTNAAGGVNERFQPGTLMLITDQINLTGHNPLIGPNDARLGVRFPDMSEAYSPRLRRLVQRAATDAGVPLAEGVYMGCLGPSYETPAEVRMARSLGADAVGMSTVIEVIAARHGGMQVLGISCITNLAAGLSPQPLDE